MCTVRKSRVKKDAAEWGRSEKERKEGRERREEGGVKTTNSRRQIHSAYTRKKSYKKINSDDDNK